MVIWRSAGTVIFKLPWPFTGKSSKISGKRHFSPSGSCFLQFMHHKRRISHYVFSIFCGCWPVNGSRFFKVCRYNKYALKIANNRAKERGRNNFLIGITMNTPPPAKPVAIWRMVLRNLRTNRRNDYLEVIMSQFLSQSWPVTQKLRFPCCPLATTPAMMPDNHFYIKL